MTKQQYQELFNTLTPRMQKQLIEYATEFEQVGEIPFDSNHNNLADEPEHGDFIIEGNTLYL